MDSKKLNTIISEEIDKVLNEELIQEKMGISDIASMIKNFLHGKKKHVEKPKKKKIRKLAGGGEEVYDYDDYEKKNKKISTGDANSIRQTIDTEKTNMAAVARELFPDHTEEGAQSQFRKIVNGERPMTKNIASKVEKMISGGQIAVK
jgi:hypothetical protein